MVRARMQCGLKPTAAAILATFDIIIYTQAWRAQCARGSYKAILLKRRKYLNAFIEDNDKSMDQE
jgi:hypothetical protein